IDKYPSPQKIKTKVFKHMLENCRPSRCATNPDWRLSDPRSPILEYASPVWSPNLAKDIHEIEKLQRKASRIALEQRREEMAYEELFRTKEGISIPGRVL
ncbi:unnamed protein product, partial [Porites evermanni]